MLGSRIYHIIKVKAQNVIGYAAWATAGRMTTEDFDDNYGILLSNPNFPSFC